MNKIPSLATIYWEIEFVVNWHYARFNYISLMYWLQYKFGLERSQAIYLSKLFLGWFSSGYVPQYKIKVLNRKVPRFKRLDHWKRLS